MKNMRLRIAQGRIVVSCAKSVRQRDVEAFILKNMQWILETQKKLQAKKESVFPGEYTSGERFSYLGESYPLQVEIAPREGAAFDGRSLVLRVKEDLPEARQKLFFKWLSSQARSVFSERYQELYPQFSRRIGPMPELSLRKMKSRWGSANVRTRKITLSTALVAATLPCIDYVIAHELAHFIHANHSREFYAVLALHMPDWQQRRKHLNQHYTLDV